MITIPLWIFVLMVLAILLLVALLWAVKNNWFPPTDRGSFIFSFVDDQSRDVVIDVLDEVTGRQPRFKEDTSYVRRAIYGNGVILNTPSVKALGDVGGRLSGYASVVSCPTTAAEETSEFLAVKWGIEATAIYNPDPTLPTGAISFVTWEGCPHVIIFRKSFDKLGPRPQLWK